MSDVKIYGPPQSTYVRSARMACEEKGVAYTLEPVELHSDAHRALHPYGKVPIMHHGDIKPYETSAICHYVDKAFNGPPLQPGDRHAYGVMEQWISIVNCYIYNDAIVRYVLQYIFPKGADGQPDRAAIDAALPDITRDLDLLNDALGNGIYIAGDALSLADLLVAPILFYLSQFPESGELVQDRPNIVRAGGAMHDRPSFQATMPPAPPSD